ncbi:WEB family protein At2g17940 [Diospyros lotus]|uniref:WEB family protein At2g17940 n=1 Tax=Diospyros lotus TaxID=55363 RepID=UPI002256A717|nr:WEB family protein At2g17940 [Diospyros lotus]
MDPQTPSPPSEKPTGTDHHLKATIDTSRPFSSVKEAVAIFGEKLLTGELYWSPKPSTGTASSTPRQEYYYSPWKLCPSPTKSNNQEQEEALVDTVKRLEAELEETKIELKVLKKKESETEVALASLNAELHKNMSKIAQAEAAAAAKAVAVRTSSLGEEEKKRGLVVRMEDSPTLARILDIGEEEDRRLFGGRKERTMKIRKKKPIVPLVTDLFSRKKDQSPASIHSSLFSSTHVFL